MMDSYNLAWKLVHSLHGLTPRRPLGTADPVLETFEQERVDVARRLIEFDTQFSHMFSGQMGEADAEAAGLTHEEFLRVFNEGSDFTSGCGIHYKNNRLIRTPLESYTGEVTQGDPLRGPLIPGRRLLNVEVKRYADGNTRQLQDGTFPPTFLRKEERALTWLLEMPSTGRYHVLLMASNDLLDKSGASQSAIVSSMEIIQKFPAGVINPIILHPLKDRFEWTDLPSCVKTFTEMRTYGLAKKEDAYEIFGVSEDEGLIAVIRPDGYVGMLAPLTGSKLLDAYFRGCLVSI